MSHFHHVLAGNVNKPLIVLLSFPDHKTQMKINRMT